LGKLKDLSQITNHLDAIFLQIVQCFSSLAIFDLHGVSNITLLNDIEKKLQAINDNIVVLINHNGEDKLISYFAMKTHEILHDIKNDLKTKNFININSKEYKIIFIFLKSKLFISYDNIELNRLLLNIFTLIFSESQNFSVHENTVKVLINYLNTEGVITQLLSYDLMSDFINLCYSILKPYSDVDIEKFKFVDLLKDEKELEKKKKSSPKTVKSEIREKILIFIKSIFNTKSSVSSILNDKDKSELNNMILNQFMGIFNKDLLTEFNHENEKNRRLYIEILYQYLTKYFTLNKVNFTNSEVNQGIKDLFHNLEDYIKEEFYDPSVEIRQLAINLFNLLLQSFPKSEYFSPMCELFETVDKNVNFLQAMKYLEDDNKKVEIYFKDFKNYFSTIMNLYIDERITFGSLCETALKLVLEKFPIYTLNEFIKAKNKNQLNRVEVLDKIFKKHLKIK
jgi:hypothetical protein